MEGGRKCLEGRNSAAGFGGKEFEMAQSHVEPAHDITCICDAGQEGNAACNGGFPKGLSQSWRDNESGSGINAGPQISLIQHGSSANNCTGHRLHLRNDFERCGSPESHLKHRESACNQSASAIGRAKAASSITRTGMTGAVRMMISICFIRDAPWQRLRQRQKGLAGDV
jgi:hypothetical protein